MGFRHRRHRHGPGHCPPHGRRGTLQRILFKGFGVAIGTTAVVVAGLVWLMGGGARWKRDMERGEQFLRGRFEQVWEVPDLRNDLANALAHDMELGVELRDDHGTLLHTAGNVTRCDRRMSFDVRHSTGGGHVEMCMYRAPVLPGGVGVHVAMFVVVPGFFLWILAGLWARRMATPLRELTLLARDLGEGRLDARARLRHGLTGEVGELTSAINEMAGRLEDKIRAERELLAGVSHELRTPLARARLLVELGRDNAAGGRDVWGELEGELEEMDGLVGDLLASARVDFRALSARSLDGVAAARALLAKYPGVVLDAPDEPLATRADATLLTRALSALLDNARKHAGGATRLSVRRDDGHVVFAVEDAGPGFSAEDLARAFEPFYRGNGQLHDEKRGVGLGLALVRRIAEAHGGRAFAENLPQGGARVGLRLRASDPATMPA